jgi:hypothetical protein
LGTGDLDAIAPASEWPLVVSEHRRWALSNGLGPPLECRHVPGLLLLVAIAPGADANLLQLDISTHIFVQGAPLAPADRLTAVARMDHRGFRSLRPGAEGLFKLLMSATRTGAPENGAQTDSAIAELLESDLEGVRRAAQLLGRAEPAARRAVTAALSGRWDRRAMVEVTGWCWLAALRQPLLPARRIASGLGHARTCPLIASLAGGRRVSGSVDEWISRVHASHPASSGA